VQAGFNAKTDLYKFHAVANKDCQCGEVSAVSCGAVRRPASHCQTIPPHFEEIIVFYWFFTREKAISATKFIKG
jgi:hypothetical protein